ncbi:MAG: DUF3795 domain-containing protein [Candidatus Bathyarchaeota archaeon]|nr:DUF3795 domain-containing protein [Candidatus Bathyarchaeota archaeon]
MKKMLGYCGESCSDCPIFIATQKNDDKLRRRVAELLTKQYGEEYRQEDINCDGCLTKGSRVFSPCKKCEIRKCGEEKKAKDCTYCEGYPCEKLSEWFTEHSEDYDFWDKMKISLKED